MIKHTYQQTKTHKGSWEYNKDYTVGKIITNTRILHGLTPLAHIHETVSKSISLSQKWLQDCNSLQIVYHSTNLSTSLNSYKKW